MRAALEQIGRAILIVAIAALLLWTAAADVAEFFACVGERGVYRCLTEDYTIQPGDEP